MKKLMLLFTVIFAFSLAGCGTANGNVVHQEGNLIVTNYSDHEVTGITVTQSGRVIAVSPEAIKILKFVILRWSLTADAYIRSLLWIIAAKSIFGNLPMNLLRVTKFYLRYGMIAMSGPLIMTAKEAGLCSITTHESR